ncbi:hypothetical protein QFZ99_004208 [Paraburkholderia atlantica]|uniref:hypothetical protein n=1 Tax=Paraburkholderia atlantica TaxID=2654982 RepID=UPI003D1ED466
MVTDERDRFVASFAFGLQTSVESEQHMRDLRGMPPLTLEDVCRLAGQAVWQTSELWRKEVQRLAVRMEVAEHG